jgi:hypothetical protein
MKSRDLILLAGAILGANGSLAAADHCQKPPDPVYEKSSYAAVFQPTCHNCYEIDIAKHMKANTFKEVLGLVKNVEIDIWDNWRSGITGNAVPGEWFVRHGGAGNSNNCTGNGKGTNNLGSCLTDIQEWSDAHPGHGPITLFLDKKEAWSDASAHRTPVDLDKLVESKLGGKLFKPASLKGTYDTLRQAANKGAWPTMDKLAGRVIVVLTGKSLNDYVADRGTNAALFVAADAWRTSDIDGVPKGFSSTTAPYLVFYNIQANYPGWPSQDELGRATRAKNYVSRLWGIPNSWNACNILANCINDIALDDWTTDQGVCNKVSAGTLVIQKGH